MIKRRKSKAKTIADGLQVPYKLPKSKISWQSEMYGDGARGAALQMFRCVQYPKIRQINARETRDGPLETCFTVEGIDPSFPTFQEALEAHVQQQEQTSANRRKILSR